MNMEETSAELQKFSAANNLNIDINDVLNNMNAGDFVVLNQAMNKSDNNLILKILQKYKGRLSESYYYFNNRNRIKMLEQYDIYDKMTLNELVDNYHKFTESALFSTDHLTMSELKSIVYEDITSSLTANQIATANVANSQQKQDPATQAKIKQSELQKTGYNTKVSVPGQTTGTTQVADLVGVDVGPTPERSLVVTKDDSKPNSLNVFNIDSVSPVTEDESGQDSPFSNQNYNIGAMSQEIDRIASSPDETDGSQSIEGNMTDTRESDIMNGIMSLFSGKK